MITTLCLLCMTLCAMAQAKEHVVQRGETLESIAERYGISVDDIKKANPKLITVYAGKRLALPANAQTVTAAPATDAVAASSDKNAENRYANTGAMAAKEQYRRSSLCLVMLTHRGKKYAEDMERVFKRFPLPMRYNEHNISDLRVISVDGKQDKSDIDKLLTKHSIAQKVVGRWFNRDAATGAMNMDLIHERGGYGAFYTDYQRSQRNIRGADMLRDEGIELLQSTFVLVCDMSYIDKSRATSFLSGVMSVASMAADVAGEVNSAKGNNESGNAWKAAGALGEAGAEVVGDIGGFRVKMNAYLYKLRWNDDLTQTMYNYYWIDQDTSAEEVAQRKGQFERDASKFQLDYVGLYTEASSKTILKSWNNEDQVILDVCHRCVEKGMRQLAKTYPIFRPRAPFYFESGHMYSHIGRKEDVSYGKEYEILEPYKDRNGQIAYKRIGKAMAGAPWNNLEIRFDKYFDVSAKGTPFTPSGSTADLQRPGLQLREM